MPLNDSYSNSAKPRMTIKTEEQVVKGILTNKNCIPCWYGYVVEYRNLIIENLTNVDISNEFAATFLDQETKIMLKFYQNAQLEIIFRFI